MRIGMKNHDEDLGGYDYDKECEVWVSNDSGLTFDHHISSRVHKANSLAFRSLKFDWLT